MQFPRVTQLRTDLPVPGTGPGRIMPMVTSHQSFFLASLEALTSQAAADSFSSCLNRLCLKASHAPKTNKTHTRGQCWTHALSRQRNISAQSRVRVNRHHFLYLQKGQPNHQPMPHNQEGSSLLCIVNCSKLSLESPPSQEKCP